MGEKLVLDLETQRDFNEVEGRRHELLGVSVVGIYRYRVDRYEAYAESELKQLEPLLQEAELVIGFNVNRFDLPVLAPYLSFSISTIPVLDILDEVVKNLGHRLSLDTIAQATLGRGKTGSGLDALRWFKEGKLDQIKQYCLEDVRLTKELYEYGKQHGKLYATSRYGSEKFEIPVVFPDRKRDVATIAKLLREAFEKRLQVELEYLSHSVASGQSPQRVRRVDVYRIQEPYFEGYCHFRQAVRQFRLDRVLDLKPTWQRYAIPADYVPSAISE
jgi:DEAD/DEAH box helicase domain-containing protein